MNSTKFKTICEMLFGRSWQAQVADYLTISRKTVSSWIERGSVPTWVEKEIKPLAVRRAKESKFALDSLSMREDEFYHSRAILIGETSHYDCDKYDLNDIRDFIENQKWVVFELAKQQLRTQEPLENVLHWAECFMLSDNDIASYLEQNNSAIDDLSEIQELRGDACKDVRSDIEFIFERINKH